MLPGGMYPIKFAINAMKKVRKIIGVKIGLDVQMCKYADVQMKPIPFVMLNVVEHLNGNAYRHGGE
jgi:hypothetical protein